MKEWLAINKNSFKSRGGALTKTVPKAFVLTFCSIQGEFVLKMRSYILITALLTFINVMSQNPDNLPSVDSKFGHLNSVNGIQLGFSGINLHREIPISNSFVIRPEIGLLLNLEPNKIKDLFFELYPKIELGNKWYYNIEKRLKNGANTDDNAFNFFAINITYFDDWFTISNSRNNQTFSSFFPVSEVTRESTLIFFPNWGIRRNINANFNFETYVGYSLVLYNESHIMDSFISIGFKAGFKFK